MYQAGNIWDGRSGVFCKHRQGSGFQEMAEQIR